MITSNVFLLCAGSSRRFEGAVKQLLPIAGEPIIRRTIRLVREYDPYIKIYMITWHDALKFDDVEIIDTVKQPPQLSDSILLSQEFWGERNIFLLGDVIYGPKTLKKILSYDGRCAVYARDNSLINKHAERLALTFSDEASSDVKYLCEKASQLFKGTIFERGAGLQKICYATKSKRKLFYLSPLIFKTPLFWLIRPIRDFLIFHVWTELWKPDPPISIVIINDVITMDIDSPADYQNFIDLRVL
jgi:hypothetical protein